MVDLRYLQDLLPILKLHGVKSFKTQLMDLQFHVEQEKISQPSPESIQNIADVVRKQEEAMPPDLRADALMDQDKILNWSSPDQSQDQLPLPLTGEEEPV